MASPSFRNVSLRACLHPWLLAHIARLQADNLNDL
jgi:hypothetical protein